jgi:CRP/FNR family cyclic AMP-dependent transcriptional regulator
MSPRHSFERATLLAGATAADLDRLDAMAERVHLPAGGLVLRAGDAADRLYIVLEGQVALSLHAPGRGDLVVETLGAGDVVGVSWALPHRRWDLDARAVTDVEALAIDAAPLRDLMEEDPTLGRILRHGIAGLLGERLHATRLRLVDLYRDGPSP